MTDPLVLRRLVSALARTSAQPRVWRGQPTGHPFHFWEARLLAVRCPERKRSQPRARRGPRPPHSPLVAASSLVRTQRFSFDIGRPSSIHTTSPTLAALASSWAW